MNQNRVPIKPQGYIGKSADWLMQPIMYWLQGNKKELPQRTHLWNNQKFFQGELDWLDQSKMVFVSGDFEAKPRHSSGFVPTFHMPRLGGWKKYVVIRRVENAQWYVGWLADDVQAVSKIQLSTPVRLLRGQKDCWFFGINPYGKQITVEQIGFGTIGDGKWGDVPLL